MEQQRLLSLDFFRGVTIAAMILVNNPGSWEHVYAPLLHARWHGWTPTDLIFPFFLFIVGVSITLAMKSKKNQPEIRKSLYKRIIRRTILLFGFGLFLSAFPDFDFTTLRIMGVLQRIAICYLISSLVFLNFSIRGQIYWSISFLFIYWGMMEFIPVPGVGAGSYEIGANFSNYIDGILLKGHMWQYTKTWDPEGIISTLPAISTTLAGVLTGHILGSKRKATEKLTWMLVGGLIAVIIGLIWNLVLPINKNIWTSSYAVFTSGFAAIVLAISYFFIDIKGWKRGTKPFIIYGMNAITMYLLADILAVGFYSISVSPAGDTSLQGWIMENLFLSWLSPINASLAFALFFVFITWIVAKILYKNNIFLKV